MGGEITADGQRLAECLFGVGEVAGIAVDNSEIIERVGDVGSVRCGVLGGEVAADGQRLG